MKRIFLVVLVIGCHVETKKDLVKNERLEIQKQVQANTEKVSSQAESDVSTKTSSDNNAVEVEGPDGEITLAVVTPKVPLHFPRGSKVIGTVPLSHHEMDQNKTIGAKTEDLKTAKDTNINAVKTTLEKVHLEKDEDVGPGWKLYLWISLGIILLLVAAWAVLKFYLKPLWLPRWL